MLLAKLARKHAARSRSCGLPSLREAKRRSNPYLLCGAMDCFAYARNDDVGLFEKLKPKQLLRANALAPYASSPRTRGPIRRGPAFWHGGKRLLLQQTAVDMGPRVRGDDNHLE